MSITLRKALQVKNRLAGEIGQLNKLIQQNNSVQEGRAQFNVEELLKKRNKKVETLIKLKTDIAVANTSIYEFLARLEEHKAQIQFLRSLPTRSGEYEIGYDGNGTKYANFVAHVGATDVEAEVNNISQLIEELQDRVDHYNSTTMIEYTE